MPLNIDGTLKVRESFKPEALASWEAYQEIGRHLTGQKVRTWLNTGAPKTKEGCLSATSSRHQRHGARPGAMPAVSCRQGLGSRQAANQAIERNSYCGKQSPTLAGHSLKCQSCANW